MNKTLAFFRFVIQNEWYINCIPGSVDELPHARVPQGGRSAPDLHFAGPPFFLLPSFLNPQAAGSVTGARLGRRCRLSSLTTAPETDILVGFSVRALCPATLPLLAIASDLGGGSRGDSLSARDCGKKRGGGSCRPRKRFLTALRAFS